MIGATNETYELVRELGRGNFGAVYEAQHRTLASRSYALKLIRPYGINTDEALDEARKLEALPPHSNVLQVHDAGRWGTDQVFIATDVCPNGSLDGVVLDPATACRYISLACRGLAHLHQHRLLHLDIRPANILLSQDDVPLLADFGLAKWAHDAGVDEWYGPHAAPELVEFEAATVATDIYAMGMTMAHLLTGGAICRPFPVSAALVQASANHEWPRLAELGVNIPKRLHDVIDRATDYDPSRRQASADEFKRAVDRATPAISLGAKAGGSLATTDGTWTIDVTHGANGWDVVTRRNNRRVGPQCSTERSQDGANRKVRKVVRFLAEHADQPPGRRRPY